MTPRAAARAALRPLLARALRSPALREASARALERLPKIVVGHYFGPPRPYVFMRPGMSMAELGRSLDMLGRHFEFASLEAVLADAAQGRPSRRLAVTIDDGFDLLREGAIDLFESYRIPVTTFVVVDALDNRSLLWPNMLRAIEQAKGLALMGERLLALQARHGLPAPFAADASIHASLLGWPAARKEALADELWRACDMPPIAEYLDRHRPFYALAQLRELLARGHQIGLHSRSHPFCDVLGSEEVEREFRRPAAWLREQLGLRSVPMAYPFGVRLRPEQERPLLANGVVSCALGTDTFSRAPAGAAGPGRASLEGDVAYNVFAAPLLRRLTRRGAAAASVN